MGVPRSELHLGQKHAKTANVLPLGLSQLQRPDADNARRFGMAIHNELMKTKWIFLADLGSLKAYRIETSRLARRPRLVLTESFNNTEAHTRLVEQVTDLAGRFPKGSGSNGSGAMSDGERHNIELERRRRLARRLAGRLNALMRRQEVESCFFAASKTINRQLLEALEPQARKKIERNVAADLTKLDKSQLLARFAARS